MYRLRLILMVVLSVAVVGGAAVLALNGVSAPREEQQARAFLRQLADSDPDVRRDAEAGLRKLDRHALPPLREACGDGDPVLAKRARRLLDELEGRVETSVAESRPAPAPENVEPPRSAVELMLEIPKAHVRPGEQISFYVRLRNNGPQPVLVARHKMMVLPLYREFAHFEIAPAGEEPFTMATELWPRAVEGPHIDVAAVAPGTTVDLYAGQSEIHTALHTRLLRPGQYQIRFVYDATGAYVDAVAKAGEAGVALPREKIASNVVTVVVE